MDMNDYHNKNKKYKNKINIDMNINPFSLEDIKQYYKEIRKEVKRIGRTNSL